MKKLLFILLLLPLFAFPQSEKRYRSIIVDSVKALNGGLLDIKDTAKFDLPVSIGGADDLTALLTMTSTTQGFLAPRMTTAQKNAITTPATGLMVFDTDLAIYQFYTGAAWAAFGLIAISANKIAQGTGTTIIDGTWQFETNALVPTTDLSNIGVTATNRVSSMFIGGTIEYSTNLIFQEGIGGVQTMRMDASNNVKIGTGAASHQLDVTGNISGDTIFGNVASSISGPLTLRTSSDDNIIIDPDGTGIVSFPSGYTHHIDIDAGGATQGASAPTATTVGTFRGLGFAADAEVVHYAVEVPIDWDGASDMTLIVHWYPTSGDAIANTETVKWDATYRSIAVGEAVDNGTAVVATTTFTGGASETDKEHYETSITIDFDDVNQPLTVGDDIGVQFDRDVTTDTYSGAGIVFRWDLSYTSNKLPAH